MSDNLSSPSLVLAPLEIRVLGTLIEKQRTVPDTYPLSLNALAAGCNQKTSRNPVIEATEPEILQALETLIALDLVSEVSGSRVVRFAHQFEKVLGVPKQASALLTVLMLRGPQTAGELRLNCERLHKFADISAVEAFLEELASRESGGLVQELPRLPGARENRWTHLLGGQPVLDAGSGRGSQPVTHPLIDALSARVAVLEQELDELKETVSRLLAGKP
ncbi:YceH family protein [Azonexus sp.]|uniref:YceH family protein n=1 Tax=Azonexus sp. TaxID=1872668 RepID=UPI0027BA4AD9|nr:YceH family protein [Azonexus sp.]